ncbi:hypothetical protein L596_026407 [Steinernema carpocapsae]|uniref:Uncharacterized protein n=1 Tax=Steinernema carpocapsae TaxID=34508 RepID=A0A4U5M1B7_STECR|nr:hypothetical protein L596_026407 [Steinernema carpocapsae]
MLSVKYIDLVTTFENGKYLLWNQTKGMCLAEEGAEWEGSFCQTKCPVTGRHGLVKRTKNTRNVCLRRYVIATSSFILTNAKENRPIEV